MPRGILKNRGEGDPGGAPRLRWDEDNLMLTESQKNSTMKITEPKTPYIHYDHETDEILGNTGLVPPLELSSAISNAKGLMSVNSEESLFSSDSERKSTGSGRFSDWESEEDDGLTEEEKKKRERFAKLRSQHYNMKAALQKARQTDDEDDEDDEDERNRRRREAEEDDDGEDGAWKEEEEDTEYRLQGKGMTPTMRVQIRGVLKAGGGKQIIKSIVAICVMGTGSGLILGVEQGSKARKLKTGGLACRSVNGHPTRWDVVTG
ncbi:hypothetical protein HK101_005266 [Irineochytrium annulatum]|nr:hypothetical protein HK101_005266 [Irineochytrium annulatum]